MTTTLQGHRPMAARSGSQASLEILASPATLAPPELLASPGPLAPPEASLAPLASPGHPWAPLAVEPLPPRLGPQLYWTHWGGSFA